MAAKYEEIYPPELKELVFIADKAYTEKEILAMENDIALALDYQLTVPTIHTFLCRSLQEYGMLHFLPSTIAASAVLVEIYKV